MAAMQAVNVIGWQIFFVGNGHSRSATHCHSDLDQSTSLTDRVLFIGPWGHDRIAKQPVKFQFRDLVALAGALPQGLVVEDRDVAAPIADNPGLLQGAHRIGHRRTPDPEHHPQEFMGEQKIV